VLAYIPEVAENEQKRSDYIPPGRSHHLLNKTRHDRQGYFYIDYFKMCH
jgi:hypothetical protein